MNNTNESFPKGRTEVFLPESAIVFEFGVTKKGDIDIIIARGEDKIVMRTTPMGAGNLSRVLNELQYKAMEVAIAP